MSRYLITGGLGLIGAELANVNCMQHGHQVRILDNLSTGQSGQCYHKLRDSHRRCQ